MFGLGRINSSIARVMGFRRARAAVVGATVGAVVVAASAGYTIAYGDTLSEIARDNDTSVAALVSANDIPDPDLIIAGRVLTIPGTSGPASRHTVRPGETLADIAAEYGVTIRALIEANDIANANLIRVGQNLRVPGENGSSTVIHVVAAGDTLARIAHRYGTSIPAILALNEIDDPSMIYAGTKITVSGSAATTEAEQDEQSAPDDTTPESADATTHTVGAGETLGDIAAAYGVTANAIARLNDLANPNRIRVGQELRIPAGSEDTAPAETGPAFLCPVPGSTFVDDYGYIKPDGRFHQGIDVNASYGSPVFAPVTGRVDAVNGTLGGMQFWLYGDDGNLYIGTHLSDFGKTGRVSQGDVIGKVGDSGNAIGGPPHVHFEIMVEGASVNPYPTLKDACG